MIVQEKFYLFRTYLTYSSGYIVEGRIHFTMCGKLQEQLSWFQVQEATFQIQVSLSEDKAGEEVRENLIYLAKKFSVREHLKSFCALVRSVFRKSSLVTLANGLESRLQRQGRNTSGKTVEESRIEIKNLTGLGMGRRHTSKILCVSGKIWMQYKMMTWFCLNYLVLTFPGVQNAGIFIFAYTSLTPYS